MSSDPMWLSPSMSPVALCKRVAKHLKICLGSQVDVAPSADVQQLSPNKGDRVLPNGEFVSSFLTMQILCLAAQYVESPSLASAQMGPLTFSPSSWAFQVSRTVCIQAASSGAFSVLSVGEATIGTGVS